MASLDVTVGISLAGEYYQTTDTFGKDNKRINKNETVTLSTGTSANQANLWSQSVGSVGTGGTEFDLSASSGGMTDTFGSGIVAVEIVGLYIKNTSSSGNLIVGAAATNQWFAIFGASTHTLILPPGGSVMLTCPSDPAWAVTAGSADKLKLAASSGTVNYELALIARNA